MGTLQHTPAPPQPTLLSQSHLGFLSLNVKIRGMHSYEKENITFLPNDSLPLLTPSLIPIFSVPSMGSYMENQCIGEICSTHPEDPSPCPLVL
jgi:hypothetical protein